MCIFPESEEQLHERIWQTMTQRGVVVTSGEIKCFKQDFAYHSQLVYAKKGTWQTTTVHGYGATKTKALISLRQNIQTRQFL